jgi:aminoglycoside phosphotransferase (APT) family kinase protein
VRDYFAALAALHRVDPGRLALPGFARPADGPDHARADLRLWRRIAARLSESERLEDLAFAWLDANAPGGQAHVLCRGGAGGNCSEGDRVTSRLGVRASAIR